MKSSVEFLGVHLKSRAVLASGILGVTLSSLRRVHEEGAGLVTTKSIGPEKRKGHKGPVLFRWEHGFVNAVGLSNPGVDDFLREWKGYRIDFPLTLSIFGQTESDFPAIAERVGGLDFAFLELNVSCPNVLDEFGAPFAFSPELTYRITKSVKERSEKPVIVKLSPNTPLVGKVARSAEDAGADALCVMNTLGPGMVIDIHTAVPVLGNRTGGVSGPAVLPLTVRHVFDLFGEVKIPIIGTGGVSSADDAIQVLMAGAQLYGIGSAVHDRGFAVFREIDEGIDDFLSRNGFSSAAEIVGLAHRAGTGSLGGLRAEGRAVESGAPRFFVAARDIRRTARNGRRRAERGDGRFTVVPLREIVEGERGAVKTLFFSAKGIAAPAPGQLFMLWLRGVDQKPFSVSLHLNRGEEGGALAFSLQPRGTFSRALMEARPGDPIGLLGPLGSRFDLERKGRYLLAGGGIGLAPLLFAAAALAGGGKRASLVAGAKDAPSLNWIDGVLARSGAVWIDAERPGMSGEIGGRGKNPHIELVRFTEDGSSGARGMITDHLERVIEAVRPDFALLCGPELFMRKAIEILAGRGIRGQASIERVMKCGVGICGSCSLDGTGDRVCVEGPVFGFDELGKSEEFGRYRRDESGSIGRLT